jgi:hypothetical protein
MRATKVAYNALYGDTYVDPSELPRRARHGQLHRRRESQGPPELTHDVAVPANVS